MSLSVTSIVRVAHRAIFDKDYQGKCSVDPAMLARIALPLKQRIRSAVREMSTAARIGPVDWERLVFDPIIAEFHIVEDLAVSVADAEYIVLIATVVILSHEILLLPAVNVDITTSGFLDRIFCDYICEPTISSKLIEHMKMEQHRLERADADINVLRATWKLLGLIPHKDSRSATWAENMPLTRDPADENIVEASSQLPSSTDKCSPPSLTYPRDLRIEVFLKTGFSWDFDLVDCIVESDGLVVIKTCVGIYMQVEPGFVVSEVYGPSDTVTVKRHKGCETSLVGTIVVPPGYCFHGTEVEFVGEMAGDSGQTMIETKRAVLNVSSGQYVVRRKNCHYSVLIESTEC
ncbi:hypothetical protein HBI38_000700 [Parastagonospora nodorum]|nr:hypothetical protein HBH73_238080 [Parastagonospora nodorum]KAH4952090.1 hypothetical protein HBH74_013630 [Parastagonospora nodorum]KAH5173973.1 hypothetical protein HBH76_235940 [Parastagonospora nodorum]KAH6193727.1 hypothetical protein HBI15_236120 [Parastagonospora nodorum]KAH6282880.1 hypothetical protein HBI41_015130 [Parastagonospora nodorum]